MTHTAQKIKFPIKPADLATSTEEIRNGKLYFLGKVTHQWLRIETTADVKYLR